MENLNITPEMVTNPCSEIPISTYRDMYIMLPQQWHYYSFKDKTEWFYNKGILTEQDKAEENLNRLGL